MIRNHHTSIAKRKPHRCDACGRRIPVGARYWASETGGWREHTNCEAFCKEPLLPAGFNSNRAVLKEARDE